ncbi:isochorismate synthase [uncultured Thiodictyon sp.]|uniref:isochorismate synthase n=1 Tax=uncultured Thiodictyon sp. TaxID=1846217 RepID=UPI0025D31313|nr:isochorismate synthase [uncultured Thiodictyon sp.]
MLAPLALLDQLQARLDETIGLLPTATAGGADGFASLILELPRAIVLPPDLGCPGFGFAHGERGELRAGCGVAAQWTAAGPQRLPALRAHAQALTRRWRQVDPDETGFAGFALLGFAASPTPGTTPAMSERELPNALLWLPELGLRTHQGQSALIFTTRLPAPLPLLRERWRGWLMRLLTALAAPLPEPLTPSPLSPLGGRPDLADWQTLVEDALDTIHRGDLDKVVLCRRVGLKGRRPFDPQRLLAALLYLFPACQVINIRHGSTHFVAATPERLLRVAGCQVEVDAIAGTAARAAGAAQDAALTAGMLASDKEQREHAMVVEAVREVLDGCCDQIEAPAVPRVLQLHNAQHLWSPMSGQLREDTDLFELAQRLHPTPATNGKPQGAARAWLDRMEPLNRGWYTGVAGILEPDPDGRLNGDLWVLLRCAELSGDEARLYAGAGIVRGSNPLSEWHETGHKLAAVATALQFA